MRMKEILDRFAPAGDAKATSEPETLASLTIEGSLCGLGKTAPNPVRSSLEIFPRRIRSALARRLSGQEVQSAHPVRHRRVLRLHLLRAILSCAGHPHESIPPSRSRTGCTRCEHLPLQVCPVNAIEINDRAATSASTNVAVSK
jgi:ferredoxin